MIVGLPRFESDDVSCCEVVDDDLARVGMASGIFKWMSEVEAIVSDANEFDCSDKGRQQSYCLK